MDEQAKSAGILFKRYNLQVGCRISPLLQHIDYCCPKLKHIWQIWVWQIARSDLANVVVQPHKVMSCTMLCDVASESINSCIFLRVIISQVNENCTKFPCRHFHSNSVTFSLLISLAFSSLSHCCAISKGHNRNMHWGQTVKVYAAVLSCMYIRGLLQAEAPYDGPEGTLATL